MVMQSVLALKLALCAPLSYFRSGLSSASDEMRVEVRSLFTREKALRVCTGK